jgi:hypothetical protein
VLLTFQSKSKDDETREYSIVDLDLSVERAADAPEEMSSDKWVTDFWIRKGGMVDG